MATEIKEKVVKEPMQKAAEEPRDENVREYTEKYVTVFSKYFAGKIINLPHTEFGPAKIVFDKNGYAKVPQEALDGIMSNTSYSPFVSIV